MSEEATKAYNSLMESLNEDNVREFSEVGYAHTVSINALILGIREHIISLGSVIALDGVPDTYKIVYNNVNGEVGSFYVNEHVKTMIEKDWSERTDGSATIEEEDTGFELSEEEQAILDQAVEDAHQEIPANSATLLVDEATSRFSSAIWYENIQKKTVILAGIGGIGSYVGFLLARMKPASMFIYDNSYVKCREITLSYTLPKAWLKNVVDGLTISFVARNPFIVWKNIPNIDPDSNYNNTTGMGMEYGSLPSRKSYGFNVNVKF